MIEYLIYMGIALFAISYVFRVKTEHGFVYTRFPIAHKNSWGSFQNPKEVKRGYIWTPVSQLNNLFSKNEERTVFIDNFRMDEEYADNSSANLTFKKRAEKSAFYFDPLKMTQGILLVGKMGSGKTEFYFNILQQKFYNRAVIHQVKAGDFAETLLRKRDILFSPYDKRGYIWDVLSEDEGIIKTFFENLSNAEQGDKKDFFTASAMRIYNQLAVQIRTKYKDESPAKKWMLFIKIIKDLFDEMESGSQNSKKDIKGTMEVVLESLERTAYMMQNPNQKSFVIADFFKKKNQTRLILDNIPEHEKTLTPLFTAFTACLSQVHTSMPDSKTDFTLYALDEYLSFASIMDEPSKKRLHTLIRSKGGILMPAIQYVPKDDKKMQQLLTSSAYAWVYFSVIEEETINLLKQSIGDTEYSYLEENESRDSKNRKSKSFSTKNEKYNIITNQILNGLGDKFEHIVYLPNHKAIYKGYTPQVTLKPIAKKSIPVDLSGLSKMKYLDNDNSPEVDIKNLTFADLFKQKPLSKLEEYKLFKKFENAKKEGEEQLKNFKQENKLVEVNLEFLFKKYMSDKTVISNKMKLLTLDDRLKLKNDFEGLSDESEQLEFIEENDLFGALPDLFVFSEDEIGEI